VYATSESFLSKVAFESDFRKKTFRCVIGFSLSFAERVLHATNLEIARSFLCAVSFHVTVLRSLTHTNICLEFSHWMHCSGWLKVKLKVAVEKPIFVCCLYMSKQCYKNCFVAWICLLQCWWWWRWWVKKLCSLALTAWNSHERAGDMLCSVL